MPFKPQDNKKTDRNYKGNLSKNLKSNGQISSSTFSKQQNRIIKDSPIEKSLINDNLIGNKL